MYWADATGHTVWGRDGKKYIDFTSGIFAASVGHANKRIMQAIHDTYFIHSYVNEHPWLEPYRELLCDWTGYEYAVFFSAGTEATEAAWKVMRITKGRSGIWGQDDAFHGKTFGAQIMAGKMKDWRWGQAAEKTCGIISEPYVAVSGSFYSPEMIANMNKWVNEHDFMLTLDEIQGGFGRTGKKFAFEHYENLRKPDLVCIGKGMASGFPMSGLLGPKDLLTEEVMDLSSTHGGNPLACAVGIATLQEFERLDLVNRSKELGDVMHKRLRGFPLPTDGKGLMGAVIFPVKFMAEQTVQKCEERGLLVVDTHRHTVKLGPPLTITKKALLQGLRILEEVVEEVCVEAQSKA